MQEHGHVHKPLPSRREFARRLAKQALLVVCMLGASLFAGMLGYHCLEGLSWLDSFLNAAMILGGMGPVSSLQTDGGKLFAGCYAIYCGVILLTSAALLLAPIVRRFQHRLHLELYHGDDK